MRAVGLVLQDSREADVNRVLQSLQLRLLFPNKILHATQNLNVSIHPSLHMENALKR